MIYLVRHAHAGNKRTWQGADERRPLSATGRREAAGLLTQLRPYRIGAIVSAPALRCLETVRPLAADRHLPVRQEPRLRVDAEVDGALELLLAADASDAVLCSHGELIGQLLGRLRSAGAPVGEQARWPKGSVWLLRASAGRVAQASYLPPLQAGRDA